MFYQNDVQVIKFPGSARLYRVDDRTTSSESVTFKPGEPISKDGSDSENYVSLIHEGEPVVGSSAIFIGICKKESTETSAANGTVEVTTVLGGITVLRGNANTATNVNTDAKWDALIGDSVTFNVTAVPIFTINEDEGDDPNVHGLKMIDADINSGKIDVLPSILACEGGPLTGQTMD